MGKAQRKSFENVYSEARKSASAWDKRLRTQEGAAEVLNIAPYTLGEYERGDVKCIPPDRVADMARAYKAPELVTNYCMNVCPIHGFLPLATEAKGIQGIVLRTVLRFNNSEIEKIKEELIRIAEDGKVTEDEIPTMEEILSSLEKIAFTISEIKCHPADYKLPLPSDCLGLNVGVDIVPFMFTGSFPSYLEEQERSQTQVTVNGSRRRFTQAEYRPVLS